MKIFLLFLIRIIIGEDCRAICENENKTDSECLLCCWSENATGIECLEECLFSEQTENCDACCAADDSDSIWCPCSSQIPLTTCCSNWDTFKCFVTCKRNPNGACGCYETCDKNANDPACTSCCESTTDAYGCPCKSNFTECCSNLASYNCSTYCKLNPLDVNCYAQECDSCSIEDRRGCHRAGCCAMGATNCTDYCTANPLDPECACRTLPTDLNCACADCASDNDTNCNYEICCDMGGSNCSDYCEANPSVQGCIKDVEASLWIYIPSLLIAFLLILLL